jgi:Ca2+-binding RTX toxin-like protein
MSAYAGLFGFGGTSWKEEVLLHDGSKLAPAPDNKGDVLDVGSQEDTASNTNVLLVGLGNDILLGGAGLDWLFSDGTDVLLKKAASQFEYGENHEHG